MNITYRPVLFLMTYGRRLDEALTHAGKSRRALADVLGCTPQAIGIVINWVGEKDRKLETEAHARCAKFLKVDHYWLATGEGEMIIGSNQAHHGADTAQAAINTIAPDVRMLKRALEHMPPEIREKAANAALAVLFQHLPLPVSPGTQEPMTDTTQDSISG